jgi:probable O-glycosylation ligase (exosortase A-associated)
MRDLFFLAFLGAFAAFGLRRPFLLILAYAYIDIVSPQRLSHSIVANLPISMIFAALALGAWMIADDKRGIRIAPRQGLMALLLAYAGWTTYYADLPLDALTKWDWAWKALAFAIFLPLTLRTRLRLESLLLFMTLSAGTIIVVGGIKTVLGGGGYGSLALMVYNNSGLYEGSIISTFAIALIPIILWLARFGTVFPSDWRVKLFAGALILSCLLMPIGTQARTGLVCIGVLALLMLRDVKQRFLYMALAGLVGLAAIPFLPQSFTERMGTIQGYQADLSANTRLAVWRWTLDYVERNPWGGGFEAYRQNRIDTQVVEQRTAGDIQVITARIEPDEGRAYHSSYFEMLGEQGYPGLTLFLIIHAIGLIRMERLRRRYRARDGEEAWIAPLATAVQHFQIIYLVGSLFVAIAFQPFIWMMIAFQIGFDQWVGRREKLARPRIGFAGRAPARPAPAAS